MTSTSSDLTATSTQPLSKQPSVPNEAITRKRHTDSLAHECCAVNGCAGLNPAAYQRLVAACQALLAKEKDMNTGALYLECRDIEAALHRAEGRG